MSRVFTDDGLLTWEAYASAGEHGLPDRAAIVFHCLSDPDRRARYILQEGDNARAQRVVKELPDQELVRLLEQSTELP